MGRSLIPEVLKRGHSVRALVRPGAEAKLPDGCACLIGDPLDGASFAHQIHSADTFIQLVGVSHPTPAKAREFRSVDLQSARESIAAAVQAGVEHFIYVSVAQPAPIMKAYIEARVEGEALIRRSGLKRATILRPWYVLGKGRQVASPASSPLLDSRTTAFQKRDCAKARAVDRRGDERRAPFRYRKPSGRN